MSRHLRAAIVLATVLAALAVVPPSPAATPLYITGRVVDAAGIAVSGMTVEGYRDDGGTWAVVTDTHTDPTGSYRLPVSPGDYRVRFDGNASRLGEWWFDTQDEDAADTIPIGDRSEPDIDAVLAAKASVSGTVTDVAGAPVVAAWIVMRPEDAAQSTFTTTTDSLGHYFRAGVDPGSYRIEATASAHPDTWYPSAFDAADGKPVDVVQSQTVTGLDIVMRQGALVSGRITTPTGAPASAAPVGAYTDDSSAATASTLTQPDGTYRLEGLTPGSYRLHVERRDDRAGTWLGGVDDRSASPAVVVHDGDVVEGQDVVAQDGGSIRGTIAGTALNLQRLTVVPYRHGNDGWVDLFTQAVAVARDGSFRLDHLDPGYYRLEVTGTSPGTLRTHHWWWRDAMDLDSADDDVVTEGGGLQLGSNTLTSPYAISGAVTAPDGSVPAPSQAVLAQYRAADGTWDGGYIGANTDAQGHYSITGLEPGVYRVHIDATAPYLPRWYGGADDVTSGTDVRVVAGGGEVSGIDVALHSGATIAGRVAVRTGGSVTGNVVAYPIGGGLSPSQHIGSGGVIDPTTGAYQITRLPAGSYVLDVEPSSPSTGATDYLKWQSEWWNPTGGAADRSGATPLTLVSDGVRTGVDTVLDRSATIGGTATIGDQPAGGAVVVTLISGRPSTEGAYGNDVATVGTDERGRYEFDGVKPGTYTLYFAAGDAQAAQYWSGSPSPQSARSFSVARGQQVTDRDAVLTRGGTIRGTITSAVGSARDYHVIDAYRRNDAGAWELVQHRYFYVLTEHDDFYLPSLPAGTYRLNVDGVWWDQSASRDQAADLDLAAGATVAGVEVLYPLGSSITGTVRDSSGAPLTGATVEARTAVPGPTGPFGSPTSDEAVSDTTDANGRFDLALQAGGAYTLQAKPPPGSPLVSTYVGDPGSAGGPVTVRVTGGAVRRDADLTLESLGSISGTLLGPDGRPADGYVGAYRESNPDSAYDFFPAIRGPAGAFSIGGLVPGRYRLQLASSTSSIARWFPEAADRSAGVDVRVTSGHDTSGVAATITPESGTVVAHGRPTIGEKADVGVPITVDPGSWNEPGATFAYRWLSEGVVILGATSATYTPTVTDYGHRLQAEVVGSSPGLLSTMARSLSSAPVGGDGSPAVADVTTPEVKGRPRVGQTLTALTGTWVPSSTTTFGYQWISDGVAVPGATGSTYEPTAADLGHPVEVAVTGSSAGLPAASVTSEPTTPILETPLHNLAAPSITGAAVVGDQLTAGPGTWTRTALVFSYQWFAGTRPVSTGTTHVVVAADRGLPITVRVTATPDDDALPQTIASAPTADVVISPISNLSPPSVSGTAQMGQTLVAGPGSWNLERLTYTYQWFDGDRLVTGATGTTYVLGQRDFGTEVHVEVTAAFPDLTPAVAQSAPSEIVTTGDVHAIAPPRVQGTPVVGRTVTATAGTWSSGPIYASYVWFAGSYRRTERSSDPTYTVRPDDVGLPLRVMVRAADPAVGVGRASSAASLLTRKGTIEHQRARMSGALLVGHRLRAFVPVIAPTTSHASYTWKADGRIVSGARRRVLLLDRADRGRRITVVITLTAPGYTTSTVRVSPSGRVEDT